MEENRETRRKRVKQNKENNEGRQFKLSDYLLVLMLLLLTIAGVVLYFGGKKETKIDEAAVAQIEYDSSSKVDFYINDENIFYVSKDSVKLFDSKLKEKWSDSNSITNPIVCGSGNTVAVGERNGTSIRVFNQDGHLYNETLEGELVTFGVGADGSLGTVFHSNSDYKLKAFNHAGEEIFTGDYAANQGVPMGIDISDDGRICVVTVMKTDKLEIESDIVFYYMNADEKKPVTNIDSSGLFASVTHKGLPFKVDFLGGNRCVALFDNAVMFVEPENLNEETRTVEVPVANKIRFACINGDDSVALAMGEKLLNTENGVEDNSVLWYNSKGEKINEYKPEKTITGLYPGNEETVIAMERNFDGVSSKGGLQWNYTATQDMLKVLPYDGNKKMLAASYVGAVLAKAGKGVTLTEVESGSEATTTAGSEIETKAQAETKAQTETKVQAETKTQTETKAQAETKTQTETKTRTETKTQTETKAGE